MLTVVAPWLEGGGAQRSLEALLRRLDGPRRLVILFSGSRDCGAVEELFDEVVRLDAPRSVAGALVAAERVGRHVHPAGPVYSLMRASNVVLGLSRHLPLLRGRLALSFHMLPSDDRHGVSWRVEELALRRACAAASLITTPSRRGVDELLRLAPRQRVEFAPNLLVTSAAPVVAPRVGPLDEVQLVFLGRLEHQKGLDLVPDLLQAVPDVEVRLDVVGDGSQRAALEDAFRTTLHRHRVRFHGRASDVTPYLDRADALLLPSRAELNPVVVWEAASRQRPTLARALPVLQDLVGEAPIELFSDAADFALRLRRLATVGPHGLLIPAQTDLAGSGPAEGVDALLRFLADTEVTS